MPNMSDRIFFNNCLDQKNPTLKSITSEFNNGNPDKAKHDFASYIRNSLDFDAWFSIPFIKPPNFYMFSHETDIQAADRFCRREMVSCFITHKFESEITWEINPTPDKFCEWLFQLNRHNEWCILGEVYKKTGDDKYVKCFVEMLKSWFEQTTPPATDIPFDATHSWRTLECGIRMGTTWPCALHYFAKHPLFTDELIVEFYKSVCHHASRLLNGKRGGNWLMHEMYALFVMGTVYPVLKESKKWQEIGFETLMDEMKLQFYPDGFHSELSDGYHEAALHIYISLLRLSKAYGIELPKEYNEKVEDALSLFGKLMLPDGHLPNLNDGTWEKASVYLKDRLDLFPDRSDFKWIVTDGTDGASPDFLSIPLEYSGFYIMRNGWNKDSLWALFDAGPFGTGLGLNGHQHEDKLNLLIYACGKLIVTEGGVYPYDDSEMRKYIRSTRSHNTVRINGCDQNRRSVYTWSEEEIYRRADFEYFTSSEYDCASGQYSEGYGANCEKLARHNRKVIFIKSNKNGLPCFFIVIDRLISKSKNSYEFLWHIDSENIQKYGNTVCADGLYVSASDSDNISSEIVSGQTEPEWQGWKPGGVVGQFSPLPTLIYKGNAEDYRLVTVFIPFGDEIKRNVNVYADSNINSTEFTLNIDGKTYSFDERDYKSEKTSKQ